VLKGMFAMQDLDKDPSLLLELKEDVREEAESLGQVTSVILYDVSRLDVSRAELRLEGGGRGHDRQVQGCTLGSGVCAQDEWPVL
jgi:hypothetical protein